jgi:hypothetical protein
LLEARKGSHVYWLYCNIVSVSRRVAGGNATTVSRQLRCREGRWMSRRSNDVVNSFSWQMSNVVASTVSHVLGAVGGAVGAGSKDMGCAPVAGDPGERRQMEAVESLIGDGGGDWGGGLVWGLAAVGRWLEQQGVTEGGTRVVVFPAGWLAGWRMLGAGSGSCLLGAVLHTRFEVNTQPAATGARERGSEGGRG